MPDAQIISFALRCPVPKPDADERLADHLRRIAECDRELLLIGAKCRALAYEGRQMLKNYGDMQKMRDKHQADALALMEGERHDHYES